MLLFGVAHHFDNIPKVLAAITDHLPKDGVCAIFNHPATASSIPVTALQLQHFAEAPDRIDDIVSYVKSRDDVITEVTNEETTFRIPKSRWYNMIRNRFWSNFRRYTDEELEESIKELDNGRFKGVIDGELITVVDTFVAVKVAKK